ncbi:MAG: PP2C family serine/threonine-protein phosphatase [Candidatus Berkiella sp.]
MTTNIVVFEANDIGQRDYNQDYYLHAIHDNFSCFVVADGLGGHEHGEIASKALCHALVDEAKAHADEIKIAPLEGMKLYLQQAHQLMCQRILQEQGDIDTHTTVVLLWINDSAMITAHVGDSRIYRINNKAVIWRTPDHTYVQALFEDGALTDDEMGQHPGQNQLLRTVNIHEPLDVDVFVHPPLNQDETVVLCSDGFWTGTPLATMVEMANRQDYELAFKERIAFLAQNPFADNITVQVVKRI